MGFGQGKEGYVLSANVIDLLPNELPAVSARGGSGRQGDEGGGQPRQVRGHCVVFWEGAFSYEIVDQGKEKEKIIHFLSYRCYRTKTVLSYMIYSYQA